MITLIKMNGKPKLNYRPLGKTATNYKISCSCFLSPFCTNKKKLYHLTDIKNTLVARKQKKDH